MGLIRPIGPIPLGFVVAAAVGLLEPLAAVGAVVDGADLVGDRVLAAVATGPVAANAPPELQRLGHAQVGAAAARAGESDRGGEASFGADLTAHGAPRNWSKCR